MVERFAWVPDLARAEWLRPMEAKPFANLLSIVPDGFERYARVFHPVERDRPRDTSTWKGIDEKTFFTSVRDIAASLETEPATWAQAAESFGTIMHPQAQYARLVRREYGDADGAIAADGWRYGNADEGCFDVVPLAAAAAVLARHTATPDVGIAAIWEGWGGLVSSAGVARLTWPEAPARHPGEPSPLERLARVARHWTSRARSMLEGYLGFAHREPDPGTGVLPREIATGPRLDLHGDTGRTYFLFEAGANDFADLTWPDRAPWVDNPMWAQSPSILWPEDHAWVFATEIDFDSTLVAGTTALIDDLIHTPGLEVLPIQTDADLTRDGDTLNRPE